MNKFYNKYVALVVPYSIVVSTLYLFGFWSTFDVNVFEYIDLSEIIKIAIFQLSAYGLILVLVSGLTALFLFPIIDRVFTPKNGTSLPRLPEVDFIIRYWRILIALPVLASSLYIAFFTNSPIKWFLAAILISPLVAVVIDSSNFLSDVITNVKLRMALVSVLTTILLCCYGWGTVDAFDIKNKEMVVLYARFGDGQQPSSRQALLHVSVAVGRKSSCPFRFGTTRGLLPSVYRRRGRAVVRSRLSCCWPRCCWDSRLPISCRSRRQLTASGCLVPSGSRPSEPRHPEPSIGWSASTCCQCHRSGEPIRLSYRAPDFVAGAGNRLLIIELKTEWGRLLTRTDHGLPALGAANASLGRNRLDACRRASTRCSMRAGRKAKVCRVHVGPAGALLHDKVPESSAARSLCQFIDVSLPGTGVANAAPQGQKEPAPLDDLVVTAVDQALRMAPALEADPGNSKLERGIDVAFLSDEGARQAETSIRAALHGAGYL